MQFVYSVQRRRHTKVHTKVQSFRFCFNIIFRLSSIYRSFHTPTWNDCTFHYNSLSRFSPELMKPKMYTERNMLFILCVSHVCVCRDLCVSLCVRLLLWSKGTHCACNIYTTHTTFFQSSSQFVSDRCAINIDTSRVLFCRNILFKWKEKK